MQTNPRTLFLVIVIIFGIFTLFRIQIEHQLSADDAKQFKLLSQESYFERSYVSVFGRNVKVSIPQCQCSKTVQRPSNAIMLPVNETEITCSRENLVLGAHQRVIAYTLFEDAYYDPQNRSYFDGVE